MWFIALLFSYNRITRITDIIQSNDPVGLQSRAGRRSFGTYASYLAYARSLGPGHVISFQDVMFPAGFCMHIFLWTPTEVLYTALRV